MKNDNKEGHFGLAITAVFIGMILNRVLKRYYGNSVSVILAMSISAVMICWCISQIIKYNNKNMIIILVIIISMNIPAVGILIDNNYLLFGGSILFLITLIVSWFFLIKHK